MISVTERIKFNSLAENGGAERFLLRAVVFVTDVGPMGNIGIRGPRGPHANIIKKPP